MGGPTRRELLGGNVAIAALLAGRTSTDTGDDGTPTDTAADTATGTPTVSSSSTTGR
jgi:hypothetical protein